MTAPNVNVPRFPPYLQRLLFVLLGVIALMQLVMARRFEINWDEFYNLDKTYKMARDEITNPLQTIFVRAFDWIRHIPGNEIDQILAARLVMYLFAFSICVFIFKTARRWYSVNASLIAVFAFVTFSYVFRTFISFRHDTVAIALLMAVLWLVSDDRQNLKKLVFAGLLTGLAGLISLKSIFYMPIVAVFLISRWIESGWQKQYFIHGVVMFVSALVSFGAFYFWHRTNLPQTETGATYIAKASGALLFDRGVFPEKLVLLQGIIQNPLVWVGLALGYHALRKEMKENDGANRAHAIRVLFFLFPIVCVAFYRHSYQYFYVFMLAPASIVIAAMVDRYYFPRHKLLLALFIAVSTAMTGMTFVRSMTQTQDYQRDIISVVHKAFPEPVPYLDFCGMISSFPRLNNVPLFMNTLTWDQWPYLLAGEPIMEDLLKDRKPIMLIANVDGLDLEGRDKHVFDNGLLPEDMATLQRHYIRYWGPIYIPGQKFDFGVAGQDIQFEIILDGEYTILGATGVTINGVQYEPDAVIKLTGGIHRISAPTGANITLQWGANLTRPEIPEPNQMVFRGF